MPEFRSLIAAIEQNGELLRVKRSVDPRFELPALLKQAEARRKGIVFESVKGSAMQVAGSLLTGPGRFARALQRDNPQQFDAAAHRELIFAAIARPLPAVEVNTAPCKQVILEGAEVDLGALPVPTCFEHDSGPFLTAAIGISRNPANGVLNVGIYRVLITGRNELVVSVGPSSDLLAFLAADKDAGRVTQMVLAVGVNPELLMAASAKVPPELSELDVAGAVAGTALELAPAETLDLPVPATAEIVLEVEIDHRRHLPNTMGEFGDLYGTQNGHVGKVNVISHRESPVFHTIMAGAGKEHNSLGFIILYDIEPDLRRLLSDSYPQVVDLRAHFYPPGMGMPGELYLQLQPDSGVNVAQLIRDVFELKCGRWDISRVIRRIVVTDPDIDIHSNRDVSWAINNRALTRDRHLFFDDLPLPGVGLRLGVDTTVAPEQREQLQRLIIPGADAVKLDDYLD